MPTELAIFRKDLGTYGGGRNEPQVTLDISERVAALLEAKGIVVDILPATVPTGYTADAFVSLHADGAGSKDRRGFKIATRYISDIARQDAMLTELLIEQYAAATGMPLDYRVNPNMRDYYSIAPSQPHYRVSNLTPAAVVEMAYMTNVEDRALLFDGTDIASGLAKGILAFLDAAYGSEITSRPYGYGRDDGTTPDSPPVPTPDTSEKSVEEGDWMILLTGSQPMVKVYREAGGGGGVIAELPRGEFHNSTLLKWNFYRVTLPDGTPGWVHRNAVIIQR
jgi:N-acetylmuramoyl-L-alanine amidase